MCAYMRVCAYVCALTLSCVQLCDSIVCKRFRASLSWIFPGKNAEVAIAFFRQSSLPRRVFLSVMSPALAGLIYLPVEPARKEEIQMQKAPISFKRFFDKRKEVFLINKPACFISFKWKELTKTRVLPQCYT